VKPTYRLARCSAGFYVRCHNCCKPGAFCLHSGYWDGREGERWARKQVKAAKPKKAVKR
jgi:hypothetical protein